MAKRTKARTRTRPRSRTAPQHAGTWEQTAAGLEDLLRVGNLDDARDKLIAQPGGRDALIQGASDGTSRMRATMLVAEILFAFGDDVAAQRLLKPYAGDKNFQVLTSALSARQKLQIAEYHYSLYEAEEAVTVATTILDNLKSSASSADFGECHYYLGRFCLRLHKYPEASEHCMAGLEIFHRARDGRSGDDRGIADDSLRWQTGRLLRVRGTALWWLGRLSEASAVLYLAAWLLNQGSRIYVGDAFHALGRLLRSLGPDRYGEAQDVFEQARKSYIGHDLKLARALTDLARTMQNMALHEQRRNPTKAAPLFESSRKYLEEAAQLSEKNAAAGKDVSKVWQRQKLDALIWRSWFYQEASDFADSKKAHDAATKAVALANDELPGSPERVEAALALGHCELAQGNVEEARKHLTDAATLADELKVPKLRFHSYLSLVELECKFGHDFQAAQERYDAAITLLKSNGFDGYLRDKADKVKEDLDAAARKTDRFVFNKDDLFRGEVPDKWNRVKMLRARAEKWAMDIAEDGTDSLEEAAKKLEVSVGTMRGIRRRFEALQKGEPPPGD